MASSCVHRVHLQGSLPASSTEPTHGRSNKRCTCPISIGSRLKLLLQSTKSAATSASMAVQGAITSAHTDIPAIWYLITSGAVAFSLWSLLRLLPLLSSPRLSSPWVWRRKLRYNHKSHFALPSNYDNGKRFSVINLISDDYYSQNWKQLLHKVGTALAL